MKRKLTDLGQDENQLEWKTYVRPMLDDIVLFSSA
jgi:hypothetical protein